MGDLKNPLIPGGLIDTGEFRICVRSNNLDELACGTGYNSEA